MNLFSRRNIKRKAYKQAQPAEHLPTEGQPAQDDGETLPAWLIWLVVLLILAALAIMLLRG